MEEPIINEKPVSTDLEFGKDPDLNKTIEPRCRSWSRDAAALHDG
jgi:hypothetical protein